MKFSSNEIVFQSIWQPDCECENMLMIFLEALNIEN